MRRIDFPRAPEGILKRHLADEADARLSYYLPLEPEAIPLNVEPPQRPKLPENTVDAPLVRLFNFLREWSRYGERLALIILM